MRYTYGVLVWPIKVLAVVLITLGILLLVLIWLPLEGKAGATRRLDVLEALLRHLT